MYNTQKHGGHSYLGDRFSKFLNNKDFTDFEINDFNTKQKVKRTLLSSDEYDNICIHYHGLHGAPWTFHTKEQKQAQKYIRKRLKAPIENMKYVSPTGAGLLPFFPPSIIRKYQSGDKIETLFLIEGEFKAIIASIYGIDAVGLGSIHGFYAPSDKNRPYYKEFAPEIVDLIVKCKVENMVYLTDADTLSINYRMDKDLYQRPNSFYKAVLNFHNICKRFVFSENSTVINSYFAHIKNEFDPKSKGIDDLLMMHNEQSNAIVEDLLKLENCKQYFNCFNMKEMQEMHIKRYFGLLNEVNFYETYKEFIGDKEFVFRKAKYFFDSERVILLKNLVYDDYVRVGFNYFKLIEKSKFVEDMCVKSQEIVPWHKGEILTDYGKVALDCIMKYDDFINEPNWINHRNVVDNCFNVSKGLAFRPKQGIFSETIKFLQHIVNCADFLREENGVLEEKPREGNLGTMLLDYLSIMIQKPTHLLPIPCLLSAEQETGKTTFAQLLTYMFEGNSIIVQTKEFSDNFNSHWAGKFFVCIDEGNFEDKKAAKEKIKQLSTSDTITLNRKGVAQKQVQNYSKFMICSNDEDNFINLERTDKRFWLIPVKSIEKKDPDLKKKMFSEIPAFFNFLIERTIYHPRITRTWFADKHILNDAFYATLETSKALWKQEIDAVIVHLFDNCAEDEIYVTAKDIKSMVNVWNKSFRHSPTQIRDYLKKDRLLVPASNPMKYKTFMLVEITNEALQISGGTGRPYLLERKDWIKN